MKRTKPPEPNRNFVARSSLLLLRRMSENILLCLGFDLRLRLDGIATQPRFQFRTLEIEHLALRLVVRNQIARRQFVEVAFREVQKTAGLLEAQHVFVWNTCFSSSATRISILFSII